MGTNKMSSRFIWILGLFVFLHAASADITAKATVREWRKDTVELKFAVFWSKNEPVKAIRVKSARLRLESGKDIALVPVGQLGFTEMGEGVTSFFLTCEFKFDGDRDGLADRVNHIEGALEIYDPGRDPEASLVVKDVFRKTGHLIKIDPQKNVSVFLADMSQNEAYQSFVKTREDKISLYFANALKIIPSEPGHNSMLMYLDARDAKVNSVEFQSRNGVPLDGVRISYFGNQYSIQFEKGYPADAVLAIFFLTKDSLYSVDLTKR